MKDALQSSGTGCYTPGSLVLVERNQSQESLLRKRRDHFNKVAKQAVYASKQRKPRHPTLTATHMSISTSISTSLQLRLHTQHPSLNAVCNAVLLLPLMWQPALADAGFDGWYLCSAPP